MVFFSAESALRTSCFLWIFTYVTDKMMLLELIIKVISAPWRSRYIMHIYIIFALVKHWEYDLSHLHCGSTGIATTRQCVPHCLLMVESLAALRVIHVAWGAIHLFFLKQVLSDFNSHLVMIAHQLWLQKTCFLCGTSKYTGVKHCGQSSSIVQCWGEFSHGQYELDRKEISLLVGKKKKLLNLEDEEPPALKHSISGGRVTPTYLVVHT